MNMQDLHQWVRYHQAQHPEMVERVIRADRGVVTFWAREYILTAQMAVAASMAAIEMQRIVEIHNSRGAFTI